VTFLPVSRISGDVAPGGDAIHLRIEAGADASNFRLGPSDVSSLVRMLLTLVSMASEPDVGTADAPSPGEAPLLAASLSIGETTDGQALLGIEVGCVELALSVPQTALAELAYAMLAASAGRRLPT
jgi:hypothetical protein